jgi:hypothetical protein
MQISRTDVSGTHIRFSLAVPGIHFLRTASEINRNHLMTNSQIVVLSVSLFLITGCSEPQRGGPRVNTAPVTGTITVDDQPAAYLQVDCHPDGGSEIKYPISTVTDEKGNFAFTTYESSDGLPEGAYTLTFSWLEPGLVPKDRLKGKFADPRKSQQKITVVSGKENPVGTIALKTK